MKEKPAVVRSLLAAVPGQHRPIVPRVAALLRADALADSAPEYLDKPAMSGRPLPRHRIASGAL